MNRLLFRFFLTACLSSVVFFGAAVTAEEKYWRSNIALGLIVLAISLFLGIMYLSNTIHLHAKNLKQ
jgi:hypothetical protein